MIDDITHRTVLARKAKRRCLRKKRKNRRNTHWHPLLRRLKQQMDLRRMYNPATNRKISLWSFRHALTDSLRAHLGRRRARTYDKFHKRFWRTARRIVRELKLRDDHVDRLRYPNHKRTL